MNADKLLMLTEIALKEADNYVIEFYRGDDKLMVGTKMVLYLLKKEVKNNPGRINERVLAAMHDLGAMAVKAYENSALGDATGRLITELYNEVPEYKKLRPLGMDFGKGNPI